MMTGLDITMRFAVVMTATAKKQLNEGQMLSITDLAAETLHIYGEE